LKGFHVLLEAAGALLAEFPRLQIRVPGRDLWNNGTLAERWRRDLRLPGYTRHLARLAERLGLRDHIRTLGPLDGRQVARELEGAAAFVLPSYVENSPNSLAEALCVGTPSIAAFVGGVGSLARDEENALLMPHGDAAVLASQLRRLFRDRDLALRLSHNARYAARLRHAPECVLTELLSAYDAAIHGEPGVTSADHSEEVDASTPHANA
jgi:glycosyltransferase involved in cell wall biosynthesis